MSVKPQLIEELTGCVQTHIDGAALEVPVHTDAVQAFTELKQAALAEGHVLTLASGFRCFERQLAIWNAKASGARPVLDCDGVPLNIEQLTPREKIFAILRWSALPGASRHHWGSEADVYDLNALPQGQGLQLTVEEAEGIFSDMHQWLDHWLPSSDFYRPYSVDRGGVSPEPWHLSYRPLSQLFEAALAPQDIYCVLEQADILYRDDILANFDEIYERFILVE